MTHRKISIVVTISLFISYNSVAQSFYGDNLGNHKATKNINMNNQQVIYANQLLSSGASLSNTYIGLQLSGTNKTILLSRVGNLFGANPSIPEDKALNGMMVYDNATSKFYVRQAGQWAGFAGNLTQNYLWIGNSSNQAVAVAITGDILIDLNGKATIQANKISSAKITKNTIKSVDIASATLLPSKFKPSTITGQQVTTLATGSAWSGPVIDNFFSIGDFQMINTGTAPTGWLLCDGSTKLRTSYPKLFAAIGTAYGAGNGSTTFTLPDLRGKVAGGTGSGTNLTARTLGTVVGTEMNTMSLSQMPAHNHGGSGTTSTDGLHAHTTGTRGFNSDSGGSIVPGSSTQLRNNTTLPGGDHNHTVTINYTGNGTAFNNMAPTVFTGNYYIYAGE